MHAELRSLALRIDGPTSIYSLCIKLDLSVISAAFKSVSVSVIALALTARYNHSQLNTL